MNTLVYDIETVGMEWNELDDARQSSLLKYADTPEKEEEVKKSLNFYPFTGKVAAVGAFNPQTRQGRVFYISDETDAWDDEDGMIKYIPGTEEQVIKSFWETAASFDRLVTFNGRTFDGPFLHMRSAVLRIKPTRNLMTYRYDPKKHCDLLDQFSYYGAFRRFSLDFYCRSFGIPSSKDDGISGEDIARLYEEKKYREIAEYCMKDVKATAALLGIWEDYLMF